MDRLSVNGFESECSFLKNRYRRNSARIGHGDLSQWFISLSLHCSIFMAKQLSFSICSELERLGERRPQLAYHISEPDHFEVGHVASEIDHFAGGSRYCESRHLL
jgi:hypothetical protein